MAVVDGTAGTSSDGGSPGQRADSSASTLDTQLGRNVPRSIAPLETGKKDKAKAQAAIVVPPVTAALIKDRYWKGFRAIRPETYEYWLNHAFLLGQQWLYFNPETSRLDQLPRNPDRVQATVNRMWPASRTIVSKLVSRELVFEVMPTAADDETQRASKLGEAILSHTHDHHNWEALREDAVWGTWKGGTLAISVEWDPEAGIDLGEDPITGNRVATGDTWETVHTIAEFVVEPGSLMAETARWWIMSAAYPPEQVQAKYKLTTRPPADANAGLTPLQNKLLSDARRGGFEHTPLTLVLTMFERPNFLRPKGAIATVVGDQIVDGPYDWYFPWTDHLNFALMRETPVNGRWTGETVVTMARPIQTALNASWSSVIEHMKLAGNARILLQQADVDLTDSLSDLPAEILVWAGVGDHPTYMTPPQMPNWWIEQPKQLAEQMDDIMGVHEVSRGDAPSNIESGYGLTILAEEDATPLGKMTKEQALAWGKVGTMVLKLLAANANETRQAVIVTPGQAPETMDWTAKDLLDQTHATVPLDAVIPRSRAAMQAFAEKAMQMGLIQTAAQFAQLADAPNQREMIEVTNPDVARARRENALMGNGQAPAPEEWDDHQTHITEHNTFRKSVRYDMLSDEAKNIIALHIQGHATMSAEELGEQFNKGQHNPLLAAAASAKGAPTISPQDAGAMQQQNATPAEGSSLAQPQSPVGLSTPQSPSPALGPPTGAFPGGIPLPPPGGGAP